MSNAGIAGDRLRQGHASRKLHRCKHILNAFLQEDQTRFEINDRLTVDAEAKMPGLDDTCVNRPHRDLKDAISTYLLKRKCLTAIFDSRWLSRIFSQRVITFGPELMQRQTPQIRMV